MKNAAITGSIISAFGTYHLTASKVSLIGRVEGMSRGKLRGVEFPYARVACP